MTKQSLGYQYAGNQWRSVLATNSRLLFGIVAVLAPVTAQAQSTFPSRPVTIVVSFPPAGVVDIYARAFAPALERVLKQPFVVANKVGAAGGVGAQAVALAKPDGYTLLMTTNSMTIGPEVAKVMGTPPLYSVQQFVPIAQLGIDPPLLVVRADDTFRTVSDIVAKAKAEPGAIAFSSAGPYSAPHVAMHVFASAAGVKLLHVPYSGSPPALVALLSNQVRMLAAPPSIVASHLKSGTIRVLATWGNKRNATLPAVPTLREVGVDADFQLWTGVFVRRDVPSPITATLRDAFRQAAEAPDVRKTLATVGTDIAYVDGAQFEKALEVEATTMATAIKSIGRVEHQ